MTPALAEEKQKGDAECVVSKASELLEISHKERQMATLKDLFAKLEQTSPRNTHNIAGYIENKQTQRVFKYYISANQHIPAALLVLDKFRDNGMIYTNLKTDHWIYTYTGEKESEKALSYVDQSTEEASDVEQIPGQLKPRVVGGLGTSQGPIGGGGLFQAAQDLATNEVVYKGVNNVNTATKGLHRALRYYMLAAFAVLGKCASAEYNAGNYIAALMVDDTGKILSYGVNSGWYHHGEVNMLLNYFNANLTAATFPSKTIIFSTLTPCKQCSKYLQVSRPTESVIFMGQQDKGSLGNKGEKYGVYLSQRTDPIQNCVTKQIYTSKVIGQTTIKGAWGKPATTVDVTEQVFDHEEVVKHYELETLISKEMGSNASIAEQIGNRCAYILKDSMSTLTHKVSKNRTNVQHLADQGVKIAVLGYLNQWISGVNLTKRSL